MNSPRPEPPPAPDADVGDFVLVIVGAIACGLVAWLLPLGVMLVHEGEWPHLSLGEGIGGTIRVIADGAWSDPASAYPAAVAKRMPGARLWWATGGAFLVAIAAVVVVLVTRVEPLAAREVLGRRPYDLRGAHPRPWARPRDVRVGRRTGGFAVGSLDGRRVFTDEEAHVAVVAPTRAGKTTRCVIPWLLDHRGPAIVTSTKRDVLEATAGARGRIGRVWVYDPLRDDSASWTPVEGCENWSYSLRQAQWLADATQQGDSEIASYWRGEAAKLLAPLLHAAALDGRGISEVLAWVDRQEVREPATVLAAAGAGAAGQQLRAVAALDPRNKGTTYMSAGSVLSAYRFPEVLDSAHPGLTAAAFLDGAPHTLYIVAAERHQRLLAPLIVGLLSSLVHSAMDLAGPDDKPSRRLRLLLDEAANIAPIHDLPRILAQAGGHGIRVATMWQSLSQVRERYGEGANSVLENSTAKLFLGPVTDEATRSYVGGLLGDYADERRPKSTAAALQQLGRDRALLVEGDRLPAVVTLRAWWRDRRLRRRGEVAPITAGGS
jgi:type IV secretion system protein VirD4